RTSQAGAQNDGRSSACSSRWSGPVSLQRPATLLRAFFPARPSGLSGPSFCPETPTSGADASFVRCLDRPADWLPLGSPFGSDRRDPNTRAPNRWKLGRLSYARQGLVRVPESNTKYGGWRGKTGVNAAPVIDPSISESKRIRQAKKLTWEV